MCLLQGASPPNPPRRSAAGHIQDSFSLRDAYGILMIQTLHLVRCCRWQNKCVQMIVFCNLYARCNVAQEWSSCMWVVPGEWSGSAHGPGEHGRKHDDWRNIGPCDLAGPWYRDGWGGVESESWMALFRAGESSAPRFVGIAVSTNLFSDHEGELFHLNCTLRLSSTMTRLDLNRNARARRAQTWLATPLWAGKSSANACASVRGQQGAAAMGHITRFLAHRPRRILRPQHPT